MNIEDVALNLEEVVSCFDNVKFSGGEYSVSCPLSENHNNGDRKQSLGISEAADGTIVLNCLCGCDNKAILDRVGLAFWGSDIVTAADFEELRSSKKCKRSNRNSSVKSKMPTAGEKKSTKKPVAKEGKPMVVYETVDSGIKALYSKFDYVDRYKYPNGTVKVRFWDPTAKDGEGDKTFRQFFPVPGGYAARHPDDYVPTLWVDGPWHEENGRIVIEDPKVVLVEGEKDCKTVNDVFSLTAVSSESGGGTWKKEYTEQLAEKTVYILSDYDKTGNTYVEKACKALYGRTKAIYIIRLEELWAEIPDKGDITDMYKALGKEETIALVIDAMNSAKVYKPETIADKYGFPLSLDFGKYNVSENGVRIVEYDKDGDPMEQVVCADPIMPIQILRNIETGEERVTVWYRVGDYERKIPVAGSTLFASQKVIGLADYGVSVSSTTARNLVNFMRDTIDNNKGNIPVQDSVSHMGWTPKGGFVPYDDKVSYDGDIAFQAAVDAIHTNGDMEKWKAETGKCRLYSKEVRIVMAAAFASPLLEKLGAMIFFTHLWGVSSGTGKTVALMTGASIYGDPVIGNGYAVSLNSTAVSMERRAALLRNIPFFGDEAQTMRVDSRGNKVFDPYKLSEGVSKDRSNVSRGLDRMSRWACTFITTGETPLLSENDPAGAQNRVLEIECPPGRKIIEDGFMTAAILRDNYGWAGKVWVEKLQEPGIIETIRLQVSEISHTLVSEHGITDKQAQAGALILVADSMTTELFWPEQTALTIDDILPFLKEEEAVDTGARAYDYICSWIAENSHKFINENGLEAEEQGNRKVETYGVIERPDTFDGITYANIIKKEFDSACGEGGYNSKALLTWLHSKNNLMTERDGVWTYKKKINGKSLNVVRMALPKEIGGIENRPSPNDNVLEFPADVF